MGIALQKRFQGRAKRHRSIRKKIRGSAERPRLSVYKSLRHIYVQLIDDDKGHTIVAANTLEKRFKDELKTGVNKTAAKKIGEVLVEKAKTKDISAIVFDRSGYLYHGCVKVIADTLRENGITF
jgi:large subunit ribosomal protein L18